MAVRDFLTPEGIRAEQERSGRPVNDSRSSVDLADAGYQKLFADFLLNGMYTREVLPQATRELLAVACLTALYRPDNLRSHIRWALQLNPREQVQEAILQGAIFGGFPCVAKAMTVYEEVIAELDAG